MWCCCGDRFGETELHRKHIIKSNYISNLSKKYADEKLEVADGESKGVNLVSEAVPI